MGSQRTGLEQETLVLVKVCLALLLSRHAAQHLMRCHLGHYGKALRILHPSPKFLKIMERIQMNNLANKGVYIIEKDGSRNENVIKASTKGAIKGAATGALIGCRFGPVGLAVGTGIGGILGYLFDED